MKHPLTSLAAILLAGCIGVASGESAAATPDVSTKAAWNTQEPVHVLGGADHVSGHPGKPGVSLSLNDAYVGFSTSDNCVPFDLTSYAVGTPITILPEADYPYDATINPSGTQVWIPGASGDGVVVVNRWNNTVQARIDVGEYPVGVVFTDDGGRALVSNRDTEDIFVIDTSTYAVIDTVQLAHDPGNMALDPVSKRIYVAEWYSDLLFEISSDGATVTNSVSVGSSLWQLVVSPDGQLIYVTDRSTDQVRVIDQATLTQVDAVGVGDDPWGIDITLDGSKLVVACEDDQTVHIVDTETLMGTIIPLDPDADARDVDILDSEMLAFVCGGKVGTTDPVYVIDLAGDSLLTSFDVTGGTNANVIAVQAQMNSGVIPAVEEMTLRPPVMRLGSYPNPFNPELVVEFELTMPGRVTLKVYDVMGREVATLVDENLRSGPQKFKWAGTDDQGSPVTSGVYFLRLQAGEMSRTTKAILMK